MFRTIKNLMIAIIILFVIFISPIGTLLIEILN